MINIFLNPFFDVALVITPYLIYREMKESNEIIESPKAPEKGGYFTVKSQLVLSELPIGHVIAESDFSSVNPNGVFTQLEYHEEEREGRKPYDVSPGTYSIFQDNSGFHLVKTSFVNDAILEEFADTNEVESKIDCFFNNIPTYKKLGFEVAKRGMLIYGPAGTGKSTCINKTARKYIEDGKTAVITWATDRYEAYDVKEFIKTFGYIGVEKLIFVAEDIGGVEMEGARVKSDPSLLSLLDNQEKTFKIATMIIGTTNHPEMFLANLTNRPNRFDDKIKVGFPKPEARVGLLKFFAKDFLPISDEALDIIFSTKCKEFSPAHIREVIIRSMIFNKIPSDVMVEMIKEIENYKKDFAESNGGGMGFNS